MKDQVQEVIKTIEENNWVKVLGRCQSLKERLDKLMEFLPETWLWSPIPARQLVYYLHQKHGLDFGVCPYYEMEDDRQYCTAMEERTECLCAIPEAYCVFRDKDGKPKYPEFLYITLLERAENASDAMHLLGNIESGAAE